MKLYLWLIGVISVASYILIWNFAPEFSTYSIGVFKVFISVLLFWVFDAYVMDDIDTIHELKKGNIAYAIFLLAFAILIFGAIFNS